MLRLSLLLATLVSCYAASPNLELDALRFNQIQGIATGNSAHHAPADAVLAYLKNATWNSPSAYLPQAFAFDHLTITHQLNLGITLLELFVNDDYTGGRYAQAAGLKLAGLNGTLADPSLMMPGYKVFGMADWDYNSSVYLVDDFIAEVLNWTIVNPNHLPLTIVVHPGKSASVSAAAPASVVAELNTSTVAGPTTFIVPEPLGDGTAFPAVTDLLNFDKDIRKLLPAYKLFTPDDLRLNNATLRAAAFPPNGAWPTIAELRGKIMFVTDPDNLVAYKVAYPGLKGALMFLGDDSKSDDPDVLFLDVQVDTVFGLNNTNKLPADINAQVDAAALTIAAKVAEGYLVRTGADRFLIEAHANYDYRYKVFAAIGGAHWIMSNAEVVQRRLIPTSTYSVSAATVPSFHGRTMICNPVTTSLYTNITSAASTTSAGVVACPYSATLPAEISSKKAVTPAAAPSSSTMAPATAPTAASAPAAVTAAPPTPSAATSTFVSASLPATVAACFCTLWL